MTNRHARNAPGAWYVDTRCIDCSAARTVAPGLIVRRGGQSVLAGHGGSHRLPAAEMRARLTALLDRMA